MAFGPYFIIGVDLGTRHDYTALSVMQQHVMPDSLMDLLIRKRAGEFDYGYRQTGAYGQIVSRALTPSSVHQYRYDLIDLQRWRGEGYSVVVPKLREVMQRLRQLGFDQQREEGRYQQHEPGIGVLVDGTGVGVAVVEEIRNAGIPCIGVTITGGDAISHDRDDYRVPKRELVTRTQVVMETKRLQIASQLQHAPTLVSEMDNFKIKKIALTGNDSYGAGADWRDGNHDDLVLSVAMGLWWGEHTATDDVQGMQFSIEMEDYMRLQ